MTRNTHVPHTHTQLIKLWSRRLSPQQNSHSEEYRYSQVPTQAVDTVFPMKRILKLLRELGRFFSPIRTNITKEWEYFIKLSSNLKICSIIKRSLQAKFPCWKTQKMILPDWHPLHYLGPDLFTQPYFSLIFNLLFWFKLCVYQSSLLAHRTTISQSLPRI